MTATTTTPAPPTADARPLFCGGCRFDLRYAADRCPECGRRFDRGVLTESLIPWEYGAYAGRVRAYFKTVWLVTTRPRRVAELAARPMSLTAARVYRRVTIWLGAILWGAEAWLLRKWVAPHAPRPVVGAQAWQYEWTKLLTDGGSFAALIVGLLAALWVMAYTPGWFFRPGRRGDVPAVRAAAVGAYASTGVLWVSCLLPVYAAGFWIEGTWNDLTIDSLWRDLGLWAGVLAVWLAHTAYLLWRTTRCGPLRVAASLLVLPMAWAVVLTVLPAAVELTFVMAALIRASLTRS